jgi:cytidylate kinase
LTIVFRALTVTAECGAGRRVIAERVAELLGWNLLDEALIESVARTVGLPAETVAEYDERVGSWWHRFHLAGLRAAALQACIGETVLFGEEAVLEATQRAIAIEAWKGSCVIVGRGAQCVLQDREDVLHVFLYGPRLDRILRIRSEASSDGEAVELVRSTDAEQARYIRAYYDCDWKDPHLYDMMISSKVGAEATANLIVKLVRGARKPGQVAARV